MMLFAIMVESLSFDDFCEICRKEPATTEDDLMRAFRKVDVNGDGFITNSELRKMLTTVCFLCACIQSSFLHCVLCLLHMFCKQSVTYLQCSCGKPSHYYEADTAVSFGSVQQTAHRKLKLVLTGAVEVMF